MISHVCDSDDVRLALENILGATNQASACCWTVAPSAGSQAVTVRRVDDWLLLQAVLETPEGDRRPTAQFLTELLRRNAVLPGGAKFSLGDRGQQVLLTAELPLHEDLDLESRMGETSRALARHAAWESIAPVHDFNGAEPSTHALDVERALSDSERAELTQLADQAGWPFRERTPGQLVLRLEVGDRLQQACLAQRADKSYRLWTDLEVPGDLPPRARLAVELVLLTASRLVRMVRAAAAWEPGGHATVWEMVWSGRPAPGELKHALAAMSVACRITADEVEALGDEQLANDYLDLRGWSSCVAG